MGCGASTKVAAAQDEQPLLQKAIPKDDKGEPPRAGSPVKRQQQQENADLVLENFVVFTGEEPLGKGGFSIVYPGKRKTDQKEVAVKCVVEASLDAEDKEALDDEISIMRKLSHPHVVNFFGMERVDGKIYIMMEKVHGGELFDRVVQLESYSELQARATTLVLLDAIRYLHSQRICHRDLKPENLLLSHDDDPTDIKLADFGFAAEVERDAATGGPLGTLTTTCGTPGYVAPEVITATPDRPYGLTCDMWSIGVIIFVLLGGYPPFDDGADDEDGGGGDDNSALFKRILKGEYEFHDEFWCDISEAAKDFIRRLLTVKPADRITAEEALQHPWLELGEEELKNRDLQHNLVAMKAWNRKRKFKRAMNTVRATVRMKLLLKGITSAAAASESEGGGGGEEGKEKEMKEEGGEKEKEKKETETAETTAAAS